MKLSGEAIIAVILDHHDRQIEHLRMALGVAMRATFGDRCVATKNDADNVFWATGCCTRSDRCPQVGLTTQASALDAAGPAPHAAHVATLEGVVLVGVPDGRD